MTLTENTIWKPREIFVLHVAILFFVILSIPYDLNLYRSLSGSGFSFQNLFQLATFRTSFVPESLYVGTHLEGYYNWLIALLIALIGALVLGRLQKKKDRQAYLQDYYWLRVLLRYRLALAVIFTGIVKIVPIQIPEPTLSDLHTEYGDFLLWKIYYLTNAVSSAGYLPLLGILEITGGLLLLNRKTTAIGAGLLAALLLNIVLVNYVYEIGEQVYSSFLLLLALAILWYDVPRLYSLLFKESKTYPDGFIPYYSAKIGKFRPLLQVLFLVVISAFGLLTFISWQSTNYPFPNTRGIADVKGIYDVEEFVIKGDTIPYSLTHPTRWQNVVFEEWNTLSIRSNEPVKVDSLKPRIVYQKDNERNYEQSGNGGRHFYRYEHAEEDGKQTLQFFHKTDTTRQYTFSFEKIGKDEIILRGQYANGDSLHVKLVRQPKKYLLHEGRRKPIKIY